MNGASGPAVLLLGDLDMAHPLRLAGADVTVVGDRSCPARFSRYGFGFLPDPRPDEDALVRLLVQAGRARGTAPLFFQDDAALLFVSRNRAALARGTCFLLPDAELVEDLVDKERFAALAARTGLPVPQTRVLSGAGAAQADDLAFPLLVKPRTRDAVWIERTGGTKATVVEDRRGLAQLVDSLRGEHRTVLLQQLVPGPESRIESYHVYVDASGQVAAEFTGRKVRTRPPAHGFSTAVVTTEAPDVRALGRAVVRELGLVGVAKVDVKRGPAGRLWLLEVNPRFNLWHHLGARAGVNLPALVLADLTGRPRPPVGRARPGYGWCHVPLDLLAARDADVALRSWLGWRRRCTPTVAGLDLTDPMPFLRGRLVPRLVPGGLLS